MEKKKSLKKRTNRPKTYEKSDLKIIGSLDEVLKVSVDSAKKPEKQSGK
jgi:hypothetical protein